MNSLHPIACILLMSVCNVDWIQAKREAVALEGDELAKMMLNSTVPRFAGQMALFSKKNNINRISRESFGNLTTLCCIDLRSNRLKSVDEDAFSDLKYLKDVLLSRNDIQIVQSDLFKFNQRVEYLDLSYNRISVIEKNAFKNLKLLSNLYLSGNPLKQLEGDIFNNNKNLYRLDLSNIQLKQVNESLFKNLVKLVTLDLSDNAIVNINENLFNNNIKLDTIRLNRNRIEHVHKRMFHNLKKVKDLYLNDNHISELNEECFNQMSKMRYLYLSNNKIESLPPNLFIKNRVLEYLDINNNTIKSLPKGLFKHNINLGRLFLHHNQLNEITRENFEMTEYLNVLNMGHNNITRLDATSFDNTQLDYLDLQFNEIEQLPIEIFHKVNDTLTTLILDNNKLQMIHEDVFSVGMKSLLTLKLDHNKMIDCQFFQFKYFPGLTHLYLNNNKLQNVENILMDDDAEKSKLQNFYLEFNEIDNVICLQLLDLKFLNLSNNKITVLETYTVFYLNSFTVDVRNNRILEVNWSNLMVPDFGIGRLYLWESVIPITSAKEINSLEYYGHETIFKLKKYYLTVSAVLREIEEIICEDDLIIVSLDIHNNHLQRIDCLSKVWTLHFIDLSYNELTTLKKEHFAKMIYLETLDISHNQLTSLDLNIFPVLLKLSQFYCDKCQVIYSWQYYQITEMFPNLTHISMQNNSIYCPLLSTIIQKFQNSNITIRDYKQDVSIIFDSVHNISCENYQSLKELLILIVYCMNFLLTTIIIIVLSIIHHRNNIRIRNIHNFSLNSAHSL